MVFVRPVANLVSQQSWEANEQSGAHTKNFSNFFVL